MEFSKTFVTFFAFIEGMAVISIEFLGAKILSSFYGNSLYVWTPAIGVTMAGLALGYFSGGIFIKHTNGKIFLSGMILCGSLFMLSIPVIAPAVFLWSSATGVYLGNFTSAVLLLLPAVTCFGMINPVLIANTGNNMEPAGQRTGIVYAASTLGAVITALLLGFIIIPAYGIIIPVCFFTAWMGIVLVVLMLSGEKNNKSWIFAAMGCLLLICGLLVMVKTATKNYIFRQHHILYETDGVLGELSVIDHYHDRPKRLAYVNNISQTNQDIKSGISNGLYIHRISSISSFKPEGARSLILGMGGGSLAKEFLGLNFRVDICEIDERMAAVSSEFFGLDTAQVNIVIDDARHFVNTMTKRYDIIVFDIALGEIQPSHLFSLESFNKVKRLMSDDQSFVFFHYTEHSQNQLPTRSLCKTLQMAGFLVKEFVPKPGIEDDKLFIAMISPPDMNLFNPGRQNTCCAQFGDMNHLAALQPVITSNGIILSDDKPLLDYINRETIVFYRQQAIENLIYKRLGSNNF